MNKISQTILVILLVTNLSYAERIHSTHDGDTFQLETPQTYCLQKNRKPQDHQGIRVSWADAPELKQPYGIQSKYELARLIEGKDVVLTCKGCSFTRRVCHVHYQGVSIGELMVRQGHAFDSPKYSGGAYRDEEEAAKAEKLGLWAILPSGGVRPWDWRHKK